MQQSRIHAYTCAEGDQLPAAFNSAKALGRLLQATAHIHDAFRLIEHGKSLQVGNVVGFIDLGRARLEILPKVSGFEGAFGNPAAFLLDILTTAGVFPRTKLTSAKIAMGHTLFEGLAHVFAEDMLDRLSRGVPRRYAALDEDSTVIRGRIDFRRLAVRTPGHDQTVPIRHAPLDFDNDLSRVLKATAVELRAMVRSLRTASILQHAVRMLDRVSTIRLTPESVSALQLSPLESEWQPSIEFARALSLGTPPTPVTAGEIPLFGLTFSLDDLFESILRKVLPQALAGSGLKLRRSGRKNYLLRSKITGHYALELRPDYVFADSNDIVRLVADAKWKRLIPTKLPSFGLTPSDAYQLTTYMAYHGMRRGVLFFPADRWMPAASKAWTTTFSLIDHIGGKEIRLVCVELASLCSREKSRRFEAMRKLREAVLEAAEPVHIVNH